MTDQYKLFFIKTLHTIIWVFFNGVLIYLFYAVTTNQINLFVWLGVGLIFAEGVILLIFKNKCPLTVVARNYSDSGRDNFDIFLPNWLAKYNKRIYTSFFVFILFILLFRIFWQH